MAVVTAARVGKKLRAKDASAAKSSKKSTGATEPDTKEQLQKARRIVLDNFLGQDDLESDEEPEINRIGDVPLAYYKEFSHIGYDIEGEPIAKTMDIDEKEIDRLIRAHDDPDSWRIIRDPKNQREIRLTDLDLEIIRRIREGKLGVAPLDESEFQVELPFEDNKQPLFHQFPRKDNFVPNKHLEKKIVKIITQIRCGKYIERKRREKPAISDIWKDGEEIKLDDDLDDPDRMIQAPKNAPPSHAESYNPSPEYLPTEEEAKQWEETNPYQRKTNFLPQLFTSLRRVPGYKNLLMERFERCLDLYMCPRLLVQPTGFSKSEELISALPDLNDFKPFPEKIGMVLRWAGSDVVSLNFSKHSELLAAGFRDGSLSVYSTAASPYQLPLLYIRTKSTGTAYSCQGVQFHPTLPLLVFTRANYLFACLIRWPHINFYELRDLVLSQWNKAVVEAAADDNDDVPAHLKPYVEAIGAMRYDPSLIPEICETNRPATVGVWRSFKSDTFFEGYDPQNYEQDEDGEIETDHEEDEDTGHVALTSKDWTETNRFAQLMATGNRFIIAGFIVSLGAQATCVDVHRKGAYIVTSSPRAASTSQQCLLHSLRKRKTIAPLRKSLRTDLVFSAKFHPVKPWILIGFQRSTRVYNLQQQSTEQQAVGEKVKKKDIGQLIQRFRGMDQATGLDVHPHGNHAFRVTTHGKLMWHDFDYGAFPFKTLAVEEAGSLLSVQHHPKLPLLACGTSLGHVQLVHATTAPDSLEDAQIVPLIKLNEKDAGVSAMAWHPDKHWLASGHSDGKIVLWV